MDRKQNRDFSFATYRQHLSLGLIRRINVDLEKARKLTGFMPEKWPLPYSKALGFVAASVAGAIFASMCGKPWTNGWWAVAGLTTGAILVWQFFTFAGKNDEMIYKCAEESEEFYDVLIKNGAIEWVEETDEGILKRGFLTLAGDLQRENNARLRQLGHPGFPEL